MLTAEPYKIQVGSSFLVHRNNPWDEKSMNQKVNEIIKIQGSLDHLLDDYKDYCETTNRDISITRIDSEDSEKRLSLIKDGFQMTEISHNISCRVDQLKNMQVVQGEFSASCEIQDLLRLTDNMFRHGRFAEDPLISRNISNIRYKHWVSDMVKGEESAIFMKKKGVLIAFMFYEQKNNEISLKLGGIKNKHAHLALGFWSHVLSSFNTDTIINTVISATNTSILNLYNHFGFKVRQAIVGYHKHY